MLLGECENGEVLSGVSVEVLLGECEDGKVVGSVTRVVSEGCWL